MTRMVRKTSAGGCQWVVVSVLSFPILVIGFAALDAGLLGVPVWIFWTWIIKKAVQEEASTQFPEGMRDNLASEGFRQGGKEVTVKGKSWSNAAIPLPRHITTKYVIKDDD